LSEETRQIEGDEVLIEALGRGATQIEAAALAGVCTRTVSRRLDDPTFARRVAAYRDSILETGAARLGDLIARATSTLAELLSDDHPPQIRLGASRAVLDAALKLRETALLEKRIANLEGKASQ